MKTTPEALKDLYVGLGGEAADVAEMSKTVDVLNAIAVKYEGDGNAEVIPTAIENIAAVADNIGGVTPTGTKTITENGTHDVTEYASAEVNVSGGTSDYSTASVTIVNTTSDNIHLECPYIATSDNLMTSVAIQGKAIGSDSNTIVLLVVLYKGVANVISDTDVSDVSGSIVATTVRNCSVLGDGTITF